MSATVHATPTTRPERRRPRRRRDAAPAFAPDALFGPPVAAPAAPPVATPPAEPAGLAAPSLDDVLSHAWESLRAQVAASCLVCGAEVEPLGDVPGGRCGGCGSVVE
jgi:hypothetical protein